MNEYAAFAEVPTDKCGCLCYIPTLALTLWIGLSFNLKGPRCYVNEFYVPALDLSENLTANPFLFFDIAFKNVLDDHSIRYGDVNLTFSYGQKAVANYIVPNFYQGKGKTAHRREVVEANSEMAWDDAINLVRNGSKAAFRVDMAARPKFRFWFWYSKKKGVRIGANVEVDSSGKKIEKDDIKLGSGSSRPNVGMFVLILSLVVTLCLFH